MNPIEHLDDIDIGPGQMTLGMIVAAIAAIYCGWLYWRMKRRLKKPARDKDGIASMPRPQE